MLMTSLRESGLSLFNIRHKIVPSIKHILKSSSDAFVGKMTSGRVLFNHSTNIARCLAGKKKISRKRLVYEIKNMQMKQSERGKNQLSLPSPLPLLFAICSKTTLLATTFVVVNSSSSFVESSDTELIVVKCLKTQQKLRISSDSLKQYPETCK